MMLSLLNNIVFCVILGANLMNSGLWYLPAETKALQALYNLAEFLGKYKNEYIYEEEDTMEERSMVFVNKTNKNTSGKPLVQISPNPASKFITLEYPDLRFEEGLFLEIFTLNGAMISKQRLSHYGMEVIDISNLISSTYLCRVSNLKGNNLFTTQIIKK